MCIRDRFPPARCLTGGGRAIRRRDIETRTRANRICRPHNTIPSATALAPLCTPAAMACAAWRPPCSRPPPGPRASPPRGRKPLPPPRTNASISPASRWPAPCCPIPVSYTHLAWPAPPGQIQVEPRDQHGDGRQVQQGPDQLERQAGVVAEMQRPRTFQQPHVPGRRIRVEQRAVGDAHHDRLQQVPRQRRAALHEDGTGCLLYTSRCV